MVSHLSKQQQLINPRLVGAVFFAILALLFSLLTKYTLLLFGSNLLPLLNALLIAVFVGTLLGALFGYTLAKKLSWVKLLLIGILIGCIALILITIMGFVDFMQKESLFQLTSLIDYLVIYSSILFYYFVLIGVWMIPLVILATIYFNKRLWPGFVAWAQKQPPAQTH